MNGLLKKKRFILPCCVVCMCAPSVLLASPDDLDEITIRVIEDDAYIPGVHNLELPVFGNDDDSKDESIDDRDDDKDDLESRKSRKSLTIATNRMNTMIGMSQRNLMI